MIIVIDSGCLNIIYKLLYCNFQLALKELHSRCIHTNYVFLLNNLDVSSIFLDALWAKNLLKADHLKKLTNVEMPEFHKIVRILQEMIKLSADEF